MYSSNYLSVGHVLMANLTLMLVAIMFASAEAESMVNPLHPITSTNFTNQFPAGYYSMPVTDDRGNIHDMIISTVSLGSWFATASATCADTPNPNPACGWNPNALYDPTGVPTNGTYCSTGVKFDPHEYTECYKIMPNSSIILGTNSAKNLDLQLHANVGLLINSTWDGSQQSGMLGLAATVNNNPAGPWNSILDDMSERYSQPKQFTLAFSRSTDSGGWITFGSTLPPNARPLDDPAVFQTNMQNSVVNGRINDVYAVMADVAIVTAPSMTAQYIIDSGDVYLRVPLGTAQAINSAWNPSAVPMNDGTGRWSLPCTAQAPTIGITINGHFFNFDKADMLWNQNNKCWSTVITAGGNLYTLGQPLLKNVIVTFNLDNHLMYFQQGGGTTATASRPATDNPGAATVWETTTATVYDTTQVPATSLASTPVAVRTITTTTVPTPSSASVPIVTPSSTTANTIATSATLVATPVVESTSTSAAAPTTALTPPTNSIAPSSTPSTSQSVRNSAGRSTVTSISSWVTSVTSTVVVFSTAPPA